MIIGTIKETKNNENRVGLTPESVAKIVKAGNIVIVEKGSGTGAGFSDSEYANAGAQIVESSFDVASKVDLLVKVKEPLLNEYALLEAMQGKVLFTYLHLAAVEKELTLQLMKNKIISIAFETVEDKQGKLPLLAPMSEVAGVLAIQYGAQYLQKKYNGRGLTLGIVSKTEKAIVVVIGAGVSGAKAAVTAAGLGCNVLVLEKNLSRIKELKKEFKKFLGTQLFKNVSFIESSEKTISEAIKKADLLVGAVLVKGARAPIVVSEAQLQTMKNGAVIVDIAIDQGGCIFGSSPTTHEQPIFQSYGKIFCCVANMPGQVPLQSTQALAAATTPYILNIAKFGAISALKKDNGFAKGLNVFDGKIVFKPVADALGLEYNEIKL